MIRISQFFKVSLSMKYISFLFAVLLSTTIEAASSFPKGCEVRGFGYNGSNLVISNAGKQTYYLIQNISGRPINLQRLADHEVFTSPSLSAKLSPTRWAALASDLDNLHFACTYADNDLNEQANCRDLVDICQYPRAKFALSNMGNYWVSVDRDQRQVINDSTAKGIYLRW